MSVHKIPPPTVFELLGVDPKSFAGKVPIATKEQFGMHLPIDLLLVPHLMPLVNAIHKSIDDSDTVDQYKKVCSP